MMNATSQDQHDIERERLLRVLSAATFVIFFQAFMVAPIIPLLATAFRVSPQDAGLIVPAYLVPYGAATLIYGLLADRYGLWRIMAGSLLAFATLTALTATARSVEGLAIWRMVTGLGAAGVVPLALTLVGKLFPYELRGRPLGWLFGAMAGGMAFGSTFGALLEPYVGWRGLFLAAGLAGLSVFLVLLPRRRLLGGVVPAAGGGLGALLRGYGSLLGTPRGARTYTFVLVNSMFHSGVFTWLGLYFEQRYGLGPVGIGLALVGYGVPGFLFGPAIGRIADRYGRGRLLPIGLALGAIGAAALILDVPLLVAVMAVTVLSLGYDTTQPLFAGIVTALGGPRPGQAMGLNVFTLFLGFGLGSLVFGEVLHIGFGTTLTLFAMIEIALAFVAVWLFAAERPSTGSQELCGRLGDDGELKAAYRGGCRSLP
ncbi:MAG: MFS transporter, partial [Methylobacterium sp.]|nr:MFS transporter [Methylobacterium sp.]